MWDGTGMVQWLACWTCEPMVPHSMSGLGLGLCPNECFIQFTHFPPSAAWLDMIYETETAIKPQKSIFIPLCRGPNGWSDKVSDVLLERIIIYCSILFRQVSSGGVYTFNPSFTDLNAC